MPRKPRKPKEVTALTHDDASHGALLERIVAESGVQREGGAFCLDTSADRLPEALFQLGQALTRIYGLTSVGR